MNNLNDTKTKIVPSMTRGGKELPSHSALDSPSVLSRLATPPPVIHFDMSQVIDDTTSAINDTHDDASTMLDNVVPLGEFLSEQIAKAKEIENAETLENYDARTLPEPPPKPTLKKRGILFLSLEDMQEPKKSMKEKIRELEKISKACVDVIGDGIDSYWLMSDDPQV